MRSLGIIWLVAAFISACPSGGESTAPQLEKDGAEQLSEAPSEDEPQVAISRGVTLIWVQGEPRVSTALEQMKWSHTSHFEVHKTPDGHIEVAWVEAGGGREPRWRVQQTGQGRIIRRLEGGILAGEETWVSTDGLRVRRLGADGALLESTCPRYSRTLGDGFHTVTEQCQYLDGAVSADAQGVSMRLFTLDQHGLVQTERAEDIQGRALPLLEAHEGMPRDRSPMERRLERDGHGRVTSEAFFDGQKRPTLHPDGYHRVITTYAPHGGPSARVYLGLQEERVADRFGVGEVRWLYDDARLLEKGYLDHNGEHTKGPEGAHRLRYGTDDQGRIIEVLYLAPDDKPERAGPSGSYGQRMLRDVKGQVISRWHLDKAHQISVPAGEVEAGHQLTYDDQGRPVSLTRLGPNGTPLIDPLAGWTQRVERYDESGRRVERRYLDAEGNAAAGPEGYAIKRWAVTATPNGTRRTESQRGVKGRFVRILGGRCARRVRTLDKHGLMTSEAYFDTLGKPCLEGKERVHKTLWRFDEGGRLLEVRYEDGQGALMTSRTEGCARMLSAYDSRGRLIRQSAFDAEESPTPTRMGWAIRRLSYDAQGRITEERFEDGRGRLVGRLSDGVARTHHFFGASEFETELGMFDATGAPLCDRITGAAKQLTVVDSAGRPLSRQWRGAENQPVNRRDEGFAEERYTYDAMGMLVERRFFDHRGQPTASRTTMAMGVREVRDTLGRIESITTIDAQGQPMIGVNGCATQRLVYEGGSRRVKRRSTHDEGGRPCVAFNGYAEQRIRYDWAGREVSVETVDSLGEPASGADGVARLTREYGATMLLKRERFDAAGEAYLSSEEPSGESVGYDGYGRLVSQTALGFAGRSAPHPSTGCSTEQLVRDGLGQVLERRCLNGAGDLIVGRFGAIERRYWDIFGQLSAVRRFNPADEVMAAEGGWASRTLTYDSSGLMTQERFSGVDGEPVLNASGIASIERVYDSLGRLREVRARGTDGKPRKTREGWTTQVFDYDNLGRLTTEPAGLLRREGLLRYVYDERHEKIRVQYLGRDGRALNGPEGWASKVLTYDAARQVIKIDYRDAKGAAGLHGGRVASERLRYTVSGSVRERQRLDKEDQLLPVHGNKGRMWATERTSFDTFGRRRARSWLDADGLPAAGPEDIHAVRWEWDRRHLLSAQERDVQQGRPAPGGWGRQTHQYDRFGRLASIRYGTPLGLPATVYNGVGEARLGYSVDGRLVSMTWWGSQGQGVDAAICYPGIYCGKAKVHDARYHYTNGTLTTMTLRDLKGKVRATLDCRKEGCF